MHRIIADSDLIIGVDGIKRLPELDGGIASLDLTGCTSLTSLPENLPAGIISLVLRGCTSLTSLPAELPAGITDLDLDGCTTLTSLPASLPAGITSLNLARCTSLTSLPANLPAGITSLNLHGCTSLRSLPANLPVGLTSLYLGGCTSLASLPENLPAGIASLHLVRCTSLTSLPDNLPGRLTSLHMNGCTSLIFTPELKERLLTLEANGVEIDYPDHFQSNAAAAAVTKLESAITSYAENNPDLPRPAAIKTLLHRFVTEGIEQRGGDKEVAGTTSSILTAFTQNPNHLKWADEIAKVYAVDGCINQPVAGWSEISALMAIAQAPEAEKLESSKQYRVLQGVLEYLNDLPADQQLVMFQAEAANSLFREVHKKLLDEGEIGQAWQGVPKLVRYAQYVDGFLHANNNKVINDFHLRAKEILDKTPEQIAEYFCHDVRLRTWANVAFSEQVAAIEEHYKNEKFLIERVIEARDGDAEQEQEDDLATVEFVNKWSELNGKTEDELRELQGALQNEEILKINEEVRALTGALVNAIDGVAADVQLLAPAANAANPQQLGTAAVAIDPSEIEIGLNQPPSNTSEARPAERPSAEVVDVTSCSPLTQMLQRVRDFFSRS